MKYLVLSFLLLVGLAFGQTNYSYQSLFLKAGTNFYVPYSGMFLERSFATYALESIELRTNISLLEDKLKTRESLIRTLENTLTNRMYYIQNLEMINSYQTNYLKAMTDYSKSGNWFAKNTLWLVPVAFIFGALVMTGVFYITGLNFKDIAVSIQNGLSGK